MTALACPYPCVTAQDPGEGAREPAPGGAAQGAGLISGSCDTFHASVLFSFQTLNLKVRAINSFLLFSYPPNPSSSTPSSFNPPNSSSLSLSPPPMFPLPTLLSPF